MGEEVNFPSRPGAPKEPAMVHDYCLSSPVPITLVHNAIQQIEAQGWDIAHVLVAGVMPPQPGMIQGPNQQLVPACFIVGRSKMLKAYQGPIAPGLSIPGPLN